MLWKPAAISPEIPPINAPQPTYDRNPKRELDLWRSSRKEYTSDGRSVLRVEVVITGNHVNRTVVSRLVRRFLCSVCSLHGLLDKWSTDVRFCDLRFIRARINITIAVKPTSPGAAKWVRNLYPKQSPVSLIGSDTSRRYRWRMMQNTSAIHKVAIPDTTVSWNSRRIGSNISAERRAHKPLPARARVDCRVEIEVTENQKINGS